MLEHVLHAVAATTAVVLPFVGMASDFNTLESFKPGSVRPTGHVAEFLRRQVRGTTGNREILGYPFDGCMWAGSISNV